jgi:hypothetical protein
MRRQAPKRVGRVPTMAVSSISTSFKGMDVTEGILGF